MPGQNEHVMQQGGAQKPTKPLRTKGTNRSELVRKARKLLDCEHSRQKPQSLSTAVSRHEARVQSRDSRAGFAPQAHSTMASRKLSDVSESIRPIDAVTATTAPSSTIRTR